MTSTYMIAMMFAMINGPNLDGGLQTKLTISQVEQ